MTVPLSEEIYGIASEIGNSEDTMFCAELNVVGGKVQDLEYKVAGLEAQLALLNKYPNLLKAISDANGEIGRITEERERLKCKLSDAEAENTRLQKSNEDARTFVGNAMKRYLEAEARLAAARKLPDKWREDNKNAPIPLEEVFLACADQLEAALEEEKKK